MKTMVVRVGEQAGVLSIDSFSQSANKISIVYFVDSPTGQMTGRQTMKCK
jgi:hypothetical protein